MANYIIPPLEEMQGTLTGYRLEWKAVPHAMPGREIQVPHKVVEVSGHLVADDGGSIHPSREYLERMAKQIRKEKRDQLNNALAVLDEDETQHG